MIQPPKYFPEKYRARNKIYYAIKVGLISRPERCSECGLKNGLIRPHHENYDNPFIVIWLCKSCHQKLHGQKFFRLKPIPSTGKHKTRIASATRQDPVFGHVED